ncbi:zinc-binding alcohol dehydrogenase family protein [Streptomyces morookaense]|uniref:Probable alcohol dehydrogenase AdhA n=1 Tax=Streptomyces morookaense TaxID=1970 RepID=A0A7Y7B069_STRMO|nr:zinc-binding alcohol dehydrogenase family protein [Streptomyces morookaense]NVK76625.1 zinc-binding alcohol dehydrogenase family protein [Streptomyces morookaense]GHF08471.1 alcohol dehydrogenase [Streptomyces morookaense]
MTPSGDLVTTTAWVVDRTAPAAEGPLRRVQRALPPLGPSGLLIRVHACGVCRTDLHLAEGDLPPHLPRCTPGHEIVGRVLAADPQAEGFAPGDRVGAAWLAETCGACPYCRSGRENLCPQSRYTGWDLHGGYAEHTVVDSRFAYRLPEGPPDEELAPLLCAGIIGYRALQRAELPPGGRLGIYGFGASAHLTAQLAIAQGATVHVLTRAPAAQRLALDLGAASARGARDAPPEPLDAAILFAPVGDLVPVALAALDRGGTLSVAGIHLSDIPPLVYQDHLFQERTLRSVTANTRADGRAYLAAAARHRPVVHVQRYPMSRAGEALADLAADRMTGVGVLIAE